MARGCPTAYSSFFMSIVLATAIADRCQVVLLNRCRVVYRDALDATSKGEGGHCFRLQKMVTCVASEPKCGGELIEKFRYWMLQIAMMDSILGTCTDIDSSTLKIVVQDSDVAKSHRNLDDVEFDSFEECAVIVHKKCVRYYSTLLSMMAAHSSYVTQLLQTLKDEKIAENTLVVWISDNGPMYAFYPNSGYSWLKGGKGSVWEGGVRTPAMAWWPGMIEANQDPVDLLQITDLYTTAARLGGALEHIPNDRVTDGLDQAALLLLGEGHGRRKKIFHYSGDHLGALRRGDFKAHFVGGASGGLPKMEAYNVRRDPGEKYGEFYPYLWLVTPIQKDVKAHKRMMQKFPNRGSEGQTSCAK